VQPLRPLAPHARVSGQQFEHAQTLARAAGRRSEAARQALLLLRQGARGEEVEVAEAQLASARAALGTSRETVAELVLTAPGAGVVTARFAEPGEVVGAGQAVVSVGDTQHPFTRVYVGPALLTRLRVGQAVQARLDGVTRDFTGRISALAEQAEFTPRVALTERERADLLFAVRVEGPGAPAELKAGLPVSVRFPSPPR
jgi:HlyD family secretion protein